MSRINVSDYGTGIGTTMNLFLEELTRRSNFPPFKKALENFCKYLKSKGVCPSTVNHYLSSMSLEDILDSIKFTIESKSGVQSPDSYSNHRACLVQFFTYLTENKIIENKNLMAGFGISATSPNSYYYSVSKLLAEHPLIDSNDTVYYLNDEEIKGIIKRCDYFFQSNTDYTSLTIALIVKTTILLGCSYRHLRRILLKNLDLDHGILTVGEFAIHLPTKMIDQFKLYINNRPDNADATFLFVEENGERIYWANSKYQSYSKILLKDFTFTQILRYAIVNLILKGVNRSIIEDLTDIGTDVYHSCQGYVNEQKGMYASRYIDSKIRSLSSFDIL